MKKVIFLILIMLIFITGFSYNKVWSNIWSYKVGNPIPQLSIKNFGCPSLLVLPDNKLLVPTWEGKIYCFSNRTLLWNADVQSPITKDIKYYKNTIFIVTLDGKLRALSVLNGNLVWKINFSNPITSNIFIYNSNIYIATGNIVYTINADNGKILKKTTLPTQIHLISKLTYFYCFDNFGRIYKLNGDFQLKYFFDTGFNEKNLPFYFEGYNVFTTIEGVVLFYKNRIQYNRISLPDSIISKPIISNDKKSFYILTSFGKVFQMNSKRILNYYDSQFYSVGAFAMHNDKLYFSSIYDKMYVIGKNLQYIEDFQIPTLPSKNIVFDSNGGFYFLGQNGVLYYYLKVLQ